MSTRIKLLMVDNYDSFTYNIVQYFGELGADVEVFRNDEITRRRRASRWRQSRPLPANCPFWGCAWGIRA